MVAHKQKVAIIGSGNWYAFFFENVRKLDCHKSGVAQSHKLQVRDGFRDVPVEVDRLTWQGSILPATRMSLNRSYTCMCTRKLYVRNSIIAKVQGA